MIGPDAGTLAPAPRVAAPLAVALLCEPVAWALLSGIPEGAWYGRPGLLSAVHLLTLGTLALAITGAGWQIVPVLTARPWSPWLAPWIDGALGLGAALAIVGLAWPGPLGHFGAALAIAALLARAALVGGALIRPRGRVAIRLWLLAAEASLVAGVLVAAALWAGRAGHPLLPDPLVGVRVHASLLLAGWVGGWIVGAGSLLLPMFAVSREPPAWVLVPAGLAWYTGIVSQSAGLWALGAGTVAVTLGTALLRGLRLGAPLAQAGMGLVGLGVAAVLVVLGDGERAVTALLVLFALPILHGVGQRIVPFLAWTHAFGGRPRGAPAVATLFPARAAAFQAALSLAGGSLLVAGVRAGAVLLFAGAGLHLGVLALTLARVASAHLRAQALPGTESR